MLLKQEGKAEHILKVACLLSTKLWLHSMGNNKSKFWRISNFPHKKCARVFS